MTVSSHPSSRLHDKVAIITGSSSGIGRAIAIAYAREGAKVVCADVTENARPEIEEESRVSTYGLIQKMGGDCLFVKTNVAEEKDLQELMEQTIARYGRLDIMVNNAGVAAPPCRVHETPPESWEQVMQVNARSVFLGCKLAISEMLRQEIHGSGDRGWIINIGSITGLVGCPILPAYSASKGAINAITKQIAIDYAKDKIHCNVICPGYVYTATLAAVPNNEELKAGLASLHPLHGLGNPEDLAGPAVFLASEDARWVTGVALAVDGGFTAQ